MKKRSKIVKAFSAVAAMAFSPFITNGVNFVSAASEADVIAAARAAGFPETYVQQGANYLQGREYTSEQYDDMVSSILGYTGKTDEAIRQYLGEDAVIDSGSSGESAEPAEEKAAADQGSSEAAPAADQSGSQGNDAASPALSQETKTDFSKMTEEEKDEYISNMSQAEKNQIIKNLDKEKQMEIINSMIDASSALGMNVSVDSFTKDKIEYSIRDDKGSVVDISSIGVIVDDTGIDYTVLYLTAGAVVLASAAGLVIMSRSMKKTDQGEF